MKIELARRIAFTIGAPLVFRLATNIRFTTIWTSGAPLPSMFALNLIPHLSQAVVVQLVAVPLIPKALAALGMSLPYKISGDAALIVVFTIPDLKMQVRDISLAEPGGARQ